MNKMSWLQEECLRVIATTDGPCVVKNTLRPLGLHRHQTTFGLVRRNLIRHVTVTIDDRQYASYVLTEDGRLFWENQSHG